MKSLKALVCYVMLVASNITYGYVNCKNVEVQILTSTSAGFHNLSQTGMSGSMIFLAVPQSSCVDSSEDPLASVIYLVVDDVENAAGLKNVWISMLLSAEARGKTISFHATSRGLTSTGVQVLTPYYLFVNK